MHEPRPIKEDDRLRNDLVRCAIRYFEESDDTDHVPHSGACIGNIISPFFYLTEQAPKYQLGIGSLLVANCLEFCIFLILRFAFIWENKKKERAAAERGVTHEDVTAFSDLTDKQNPKWVFRKRWCLRED